MTGDSLSSTRTERPHWFVLPAASHTENTMALLPTAMLPLIADPLTCASCVTAQLSDTLGKYVVFAAQLPSTLFSV